MLGSSRGRSSGGLGRGGFRNHKLLNHVASITHAVRKVRSASILLKAGQPVGLEIPLFVDVCDSTHQRTQNNLGVVFKEVDLKCSISQVKNDGGSCPEVGPE